ncbi:21108_t:CDS:2, partial [Gigaspora margarita]
EITTIVKSESNNSTKVFFLKIKAFISVDKEVEHYIDQFEIVTNLEFDNMPVIGISIMITGQTIQTAKTINKNIVLDFYVKKQIIEVRHKVNNTYLMNKTNSINQKICSTTTLLIGTMNYLCSISNSNEEKHILTLEIISLLSMHINNKITNNQAINVSWLFQVINRTPQGAMARTPRKDCTTLAQMGLTTLPFPSPILQTALNANPILLSTEQILSSRKTQDQNNQIDHDFN